MLGCLCDIILNPLPPLSRLLIKFTEKLFFFIRKNRQPKDYYICITLYYV